VAPAVSNRGKQPRAGAAPWLPSASVARRWARGPRGGGSGRAARQGAKAPWRASRAPRGGRRGRITRARALSNSASGLGCVVFTVMSSVLGPPSASPPASRRLPRPPSASRAGAALHPAPRPASREARCVREPGPFF
jgi:hypothetical protein